MCDGMYWYELLVNVVGVMCALPAGTRMRRYRHGVDPKVAPHWLQVCNQATLADLGKPDCSAAKGSAVLSLKSCRRLVVRQFHHEHVLVRPFTCFLH